MLWSPSVNGAHDEESCQRAPARDGNDCYEELLGKIQSRTARVGIIGLGYVGLPLARAFSDAGLAVLGFDVDPAKVAMLEGGASYLGSISAEEIRRLHQRGFAATDRFERLGEADVLILCVPTPLTPERDPDLSAVVDSTRRIAAALRPGQLIILESTTYPGTTRQVVLPLLEQAGLRLGQEYFLGYSPEREDPGNPAYPTRLIPRVVAGIDLPSRVLSVALYRQAVDQVVSVSSPEVAEAAKILENTYRAVNIALVNELKILFERMDLDIWEVLQAARSKPFGFHAFEPGPGLGGHCIPIDPFYLTWVARRFGVHTRFIELAGEINTAMPRHVVATVARALNRAGKPVQGSRICVLGVAYKKDVDDPRESPAFPILELLQEQGALITYNDPHIPTLPPMRQHRLRLDSQPLSEDFIAAQDCIVIVTNHSAYPYDWIVRHARLVVDTRNATAGVPHGPGRVVKA